MSLSTLQQQLGWPEKALEPMYDPDTLAQDSNATQQELKVAMNRAQVCLISSSKSVERHLYLIKVSKDKISDSSDQKSANCDAKAIFAVLTSVLTKDDWWNFLLKAIYSLCDLFRFQEAELLEILHWNIIHFTMTGRNTKN
ncbi:General transcription factor 3C polypeptide 3 [Plecturocebus cupreus]